MIPIDEIRRVAADYRCFLETSPFKGKNCITYGNLAKGLFPYGCCGIVSKLLIEKIKSELGFTCSYISGTKGGSNQEIGSHAWIEYEGIVIDITADQFSDCGYPRDKVYVAEKDSFYRSFKV